MEGKFKEGKLDGRDCTEYHDRESSPVLATGVFEMGRLSNGKKMTADGNTTLEGNFDEQNILHGSNAKYRKPGFVYEGEFEHGFLTGEATKMSLDGGYYSGPVIKGKPEGRGKLVVGTRTYKGTWKNGNREGKFNVVEKGGGTYQYVYYYRDGVRVN